MYFEMEAFWRQIYLQASPIDQELQTLEETLQTLAEVFAIH
jgi:hypothetical protein